MVRVCIAYFLLTLLSICSVKSEANITPKPCERIPWDRGCKFQLVVHTDGAPDLRNFGSRAQRELQEYYENLKAVFRIPTTKKLTKVDCFFDPNLPSHGYFVLWSVQGKFMNISAGYVRNTLDIGVLAEILGRIALHSQQVPPNWLETGLLYYTNHVIYGRERIGRPEVGRYPSSYESGNRNAAALLDYVHTTVSSSALNRVMQALWEGKHDDNVWELATGMDLYKLWREYTESVCPMSLIFWGGC